MAKEITVNRLLNFQLIIKHLHNKLKNNLLDFDEKKFFQMFGKKFKDSLSEQGKNTYAAGLNQSVLTCLHKEAHEKLKQAYKDTLRSAIDQVQKNFDPKATENGAQEEFKLKLNTAKNLLTEELNSKLADKNQGFSDREDKNALDAAFNSYLDTLGQKYKNNLNKINSIFPLLAKLELHRSNQEAELKAKYPNATFAITETDLDTLSIGTKPERSIGWKIDIDNLIKRLMHRIANQEPGEKIHIVLNIPDRDAIIRQIGDLGFQGRSGTGSTVALAALLAFYALALICNDDVKRMVTAFENVIKKKGIAIDPDDISYSIKQSSSDGKSTVIKEKGLLNSEHTALLRKANEELRQSLKSKSLDEGYGSGSESEEATQEEETPSQSSLRLRL